MLARLWLLISVCWMLFFLWAYNDSGEIHHMTFETYGTMFAPFILRWVVILVVYGLPKPTTSR